MTSPFFAHLSLHLCGPQSQYPTFEICKNSFDYEAQFALIFFVTDPEIPRRAIGHLAADSKPTISSAPTYAVSGTTYPIFNLCKLGHCWSLLSLMARKDPAVYPFFDLYPSLDTIYRMPTIPVETSLNGNYLLMIVFPTFIIYLTDASSVKTSEWKYPSFNLCKRSAVLYYLCHVVNLHVVDPAVYPYFDLYPATAVRVDHHERKIGVYLNPGFD